MGSRITQRELEKYLSESADFLRTYIDAGDYKQYIFPLLFLKRLCDVYDEEREKAISEYGEDFEQNHSIKIPKGAHWDDIRKVSVDVGDKILKTFQKIEKANAEVLTGVFGEGTWTNKRRLTDELLKNLIEHFSSRTLSLENCPEDELGQGYEYLIKQFADDSGHDAQEFYTNRTVVHLMTQILKPLSGESIYDPTCGTGGMLISAISHLKQQKLEWRNVKLYGQDIKPLTTAIARMNLFLHGIKDFHIQYDDVLEQPHFITDGKLSTFDIVLANPPYSIDEWNRKAFMQDKFGRNFLGTPPQGRADYAFFQHILKSMNPANGRCAILFPHGVLFRNEEKEMRENLIKSDLVECVIGLGKNLFYNSPMESCIVICRSRKTTKRKAKILFINAKNEVTRINAQSYLEKKHIDKISQAYKDFENIDYFAKVVNIDDMEENKYSLSIPLYVPDLTHDELYPPVRNLTVEIIYYNEDDKVKHSFSNWKTRKNIMWNEYDKLKGLI
jgi:type I restriction enzyme M protein